MRLRLILEKRLVGVLPQTGRGIHDKFGVGHPPVSRNTEFPAALILAVPLVGGS